MPSPRVRCETIPTLACALMLSACRSGETPRAAFDEGANVVSIVARGLAFEAPEQIPSGWTTFQFDNKTTMVHFAVIERLPDGVTVKDQQLEVAPVFQEGLRLLNAGQGDSAMAAFGALPAWYGRVVFMGGPGLTTGGHSSQTTVYLEPGTYMLECYVKTGGVFHSYNPDPQAYGMVHQFEVTDSVTNAREPVPTLRIVLSSARGIEVTGEPIAGRQTVAVTFEDQTVHENFVGHDLHLARLGGGVDLGALAAWMDWSTPGGLQTPAPAQFLGGVEEMPAGATGYFTVDLEPGDYAWIAEVTNPDQNGMLKTFSTADQAAL